MPTISFVIPTFNFAAFLPETLDSIIAEGQVPIEVIVFDGGSSDNTLEVLEDYKRKLPALRVFVATERGNIDIDLNRAVTAATGDYVWTVSADDVLIPGWSKTIPILLREQKPDLLLVPAVHCDIRMQPRRDYPILRQTERGPLMSVVRNDDDLLAYLQRVRTSEGLFSFCTACLVRREKLEQVPLLEKANGTCWRYAARLISVLASYPSTITVLDAPWIYKRGDNDSFAQSGMIQRLKIATLNWDQAIESLSLAPNVSRAMLSLVKSDIRPLTLLYISQFVRSDEERSIYRFCVNTRMADAKGRVRLVGKILKSVPQIAPLRKALESAKFALRLVQQRLWASKLPRRL
jgi:glycosyltransferase involved in cell wall biosynthesis